MRRTSALLLALAILLAACSGAPGASVSGPARSAVAPDLPAASDASPAAEPVSLLPPDGQAWFGMNLDWGSTTVAEVSEQLGATPGAWVQFVAFPLDDAGRSNLESFYEQVGSVRGVAVVTLEPHDGLGSVTEASAAELATLLDDAWRRHGTPTLVRFAHEMNGSWYPWGQQPQAYIDAFRIVADAVHAAAPASAMVWAPNEGSGYPFAGGAHEAEAGTEEAAALDTNGDHVLSIADDPYAPYWPGDDAVDWVGMSLYFWGLEHPWGENEIAPASRFADLLTGALQDGLPNFAATYADAKGKPLAIIETAALFDPAAGGPGEGELKRAWFEQVLGQATRDAFPSLAMVNWFEWRKDEREVGAEIDWRLTSDAELARDLLASVPDGWLRFAGE